MVKGPEVLDEANILTDAQTQEEVQLELGLFLLIHKIQHI